MLDLILGGFLTFGVLMLGVDVFNGNHDSAPDDGDPGTDPPPDGAGADILDADHGLVNGLGGADLLHGSGDATVEGDEGNDTLFANDVSIANGGKGNDVLYGADGSVLSGDGGNDTLFAEGGSEACGSSGGDLLDGTGASTLRGYTGNDTLFAHDAGWAIGGDGDDVLQGGDGATLTGGEGWDVFVTEAGAESGLVRITDFDTQYDTLGVLEPAPWDDPNLRVVTHADEGYTDVTVATDGTEVTYRLEGVTNFDPVTQLRYGTPPGMKGGFTDGFLELGTDGDDALFLGKDEGLYVVTFGFDGDDTITSDYIGVAYGGAGNDDVDGPISYGGTGDDTVHGSVGYGDDGDDVLTSVSRSYGGEGDDVLKVIWIDAESHPGEDGGGIPAFTYGGDGNDTIDFEEFRYGTSVVDGGAGEDLLVGYASGYQIDAGAGDDTVILASGQPLDEDAITLGEGQDVLIADVATNYRDPDQGNFTVTDFDPAEDQLAIILSPEDAAAATITSVLDTSGDFTTISVTYPDSVGPGVTIRLQGVTDFDPADLTFYVDQDAAIAGTPYTPDVLTLAA